MKKIVELLIDVDGADFTGSVDIMSLVDKPAIGIDWLAFSDIEAEDDGRDLEEFASYTDYPEAVKEAAARGIRLNEEVNNKCATQVGKVRGQALAQGKPISEETIRRMYSYLSRAEVYYDENDTEACGTISFLLWGSYPALKWSERKLKQLENERVENKLIELAAEYGEAYDLETDILIDATKEEFSTLQEIGEAVTALDILRKYVKKDEPAEQRYRYAGPKDGNTRGLCRKLLSMNKLYTIQDLRAMSSTLSTFGATRNGRPYSVFQFKGGKNCRHSWHSVKLVNKEGKTIMIDQGPVTQGNTTDRLRSDEALNAGQVASQGNNWWGMSEHHFEVVSEDKQIIVGPAMVPQKLIARKDEKGDLFYVYFSKETIAKIAEKFMADGFLHNTDVNHDMQVTHENTLLESWIVEDKDYDKSRKYGYDVPEGTWMVSYRVNNPETWQMVKEGKLNGYSIAGTFIERLAR